ncbi:MAG: nitroreductase family protein [Clostridia bacterium]|nr:nitroreductase family protein [Clostridia bacterium]
MNFSDLVKSRYSVRSFSDKKVENEKLEIILEAARLAPTACNNQPQKIYVLQSESAIEKLKKVSKFVFGAKTVIMITADRNKEWKSPLTDKYHTGEIDCSIVCTHMMLQAWELGIGSCWVGYFDPDLVSRAFNLPENEQVIALLPIGYPVDGCKPANGHYASKTLDEIVSYL